MNFLQGWFLIVEIFCKNFWEGPIFFDFPFLVDYCPRVVDFPMKGGDANGKSKTRENDCWCSYFRSCYQVNRCVIWADLIGWSVACKGCVPSSRVLYIVLVFNGLVNLEDWYIHYLEVLLWEKGFWTHMSALKMETWAKLMISTPRYASCQLNFGKK